MRLMVSFLLVIVLLSGCGKSEAHFVYKVHKDSVISVDRDVIFEYGGNTLTAKGEVDKIAGSKGDYLKIVSYSNGELIISN